MQGDVAQIIGLVLAANARARGFDYPRWPDGSIFCFCNSVRFVGQHPGGLLSGFRKRTFDNPEIWLDHLGSGAELRALARNDPNISDRNSVGFSRGEPVLLIAPVSSQSAWWGEWRVTNQSAADRRIWSIVYREVPCSLADAPPPVTPLEARARLARALEEAIAFSSARAANFAQILTRGLKTLDASQPLAGFYHTDLIPEELMDLEHAQLFGCAADSWVFGGMGSWNDLWFEGEDGIEFERVSDQLFEAIIESLVIATNSTR